MHIKNIISNILKNIYSLNLYFSIYSYSSKINIFLLDNDNVYIMLI